MPSAATTREKRALVPRGATLNRLWPGTPAKVRREIVSTARSQAMLGLTFFAVSHAMLGAAFYLSETRYAREPEARQASAIRSPSRTTMSPRSNASSVRAPTPTRATRSATPSCSTCANRRWPRRSSGSAPTSNVRHRDDADTPLIRAARMGNVELVRVLLAAHADVHARMTSGATALSEAIRGGHDEVVALLRAAGADAPDVPVERAPTDIEGPRP